MWGALNAYCQDSRTQSATSAENQQLISDLKDRLNSIDRLRNNPQTSLQLENSDCFQLFNNLMKPELGDNQFNELDSISLICLNNLVLKIKTVNDNSKTSSSMNANVSKKRITDIKKYFGDVKT